MYVAFILNFMFCNLAVWLQHTINQCEEEDIPLRVDDEAEIRHRRRKTEVLTRWRLLWPTTDDF